MIPPEPERDDEPPTLVPVPDWTPEFVETAARPTRTPEPTDSAKTLVRLHIGQGIPRAVKRQLAEQVDRLGRERGIDRADVEAGLAEWARRPGAGPRLLPNLVADAARARTAPAASRRPSTTDDRMAAIQALKTATPTQPRRELE
ncbi:hypothetical protein L5G28_07530 [Gordonia sp. HY285]|uniref:hypothetical protein n=1 Tax=Gordonia liuliyuniae TaxID=2911517 RepID=UPI001F3F8552|nr:hypothetical protein [Gordonia liuliyuniae]MCF8610011.1 hypothetical protein [Gordonia liuliyuniae]